MLADYVCGELGFGQNAAEYVGDKSGYHTFTKNQQTGNDQSCLPLFKFSGARCTEFSKCQGGKCTKGSQCQVSTRGSYTGCSAGNDLYIHCKAPENLSQGKWSDWIEPKMCENDDLYRQRFRTCETMEGKCAETGPKFCQGPWLEVRNLKLKNKIKQS